MMTFSRLRMFYPKSGTQRVLATFALINVFGFVVFSGSRGFIIAFLEHLGYSASVIGAIVAVMAGFGIVGQFVIGFLCDKFGRIKPFYFVLMGIVVCASFVIYFLRLPLWMMFVAFAVLGTSLSTCAQLFDSWVLESGESMKQAYGITRGAGAFGWSVGLLALGPVISVFGFEALPFVVIVSALCAFAAARGQPDARKISQGKSLSIGSVKELFRNRRYILLLVITFLLFGIVSSEWILNGIKATKLGTPVMFGILFGVLGLAEVPFFAAFQKIRRRFKLTHIFVFGISMYIARIALMGLAQSIWVMILIAFTNTITYAPCYICAKMLLDEEIPQHLKTTGQLIAAAVFSGLSGMFFPVVTGQIVDALGLDTAFFVLAVFTVVPFVLALVLAALPPTKACYADSSHHLRKED